MDGQGVHSSILLLQVLTAVEIFYRGFVTSSTVQGERQCIKSVVQIAMKHVTCMQGVAVFVALAAAVDLSMDACQLFSRKLRKEPCQERGFF